MRCLHTAQPLRWHVHYCVAERYRCGRCLEFRVSDFLKIKGPHATPHGMNTKTTAQQSVFQQYNMSNGYQQRLAPTCPNLWDSDMRRDGRKLSIQDRICQVTCQRGIGTRRYIYNRAALLREVPLTDFLKQSDVLPLRKSTTRKVGRGSWVSAENGCG